MHVLALDFDGVLCDSSREVLVVAVDAFAEQEPAAKRLPELRRLRDRVQSDDEGWRGDPLYRRFAELLPLGNRAEDFGVALWAVDHGLEVADQVDYDEVFEELGETWRESYHRRFYRARAALREADLGAWLALHLPYPGLGEALHRHAHRTRPAVVTAKDERSVRLLLDELGLAHLFAPELVLDKETGVHKVEHLRELARRTGVAFSDITFVDDKVNHLQKTAGLGVRPVLAAWGFNTPRELELARTLGYRIARLDQVEATLFEGESE